MSRPGIFRDRAMADHTDKEARSAIMSKVRSKDTKPEMEVRRALPSSRISVPPSPLRLAWNSPTWSCPDMAWPLFVHGCFWHRHGCKRTSMPATNREFWAEKFRRTLERDRKALKELKESGWETAVIWECQLETGINRLLETLTESAKRVG